MRKFANDDSTHFSPQGAKIVSKWVVELICKSREKELCKLFNPFISRNPNNL